MRISDWSSDVCSSDLLDNASVKAIEQTPGVARDAQGRAIASAELVVAANLPVKGGAPDEDGSVQLRGIGPQAWAVRPDVEIIEGQRFATGKREIVVGTGAQRQFAGLDVGNQIRLGSQVWTVAGVFHSGDAMDSEVWGDADVVANTYRRGSTRSSVTAKLENPGAFKQFKAALAADPRLDVDTSTTLEYFSKQSESINRQNRLIGRVDGVKDRKREVEGKRGVVRLD